MQAAQRCSSYNITPMPRRQTDHPAALPAPHSWARRVALRLVRSSVASPATPERARRSERASVLWAAPFALLTREPTGTAIRHCEDTRIAATFLKNGSKDMKGKAAIV